MMYANISLFHFRIKNKYLILMMCLFCDFLQIVLNRSSMLHVHSSKYLSTLAVRLLVSMFFFHWCSKYKIQDNEAVLWKALQWESTIGGENYVRCQSLFVCKHCLALLTLFPTDMKISHGCLNFRVAKFKGLRHSSDIKMFCIAII